MVMLLLTGAAGGSYAWYLWSRTDEMLQGKIAVAFKENVPDWDVGFSRARFDFQGQVRLYDCAITLPQQADSIVNLPETVVSVDREQLAQQRLVVQQIRLVQPRLELIRDVDGKWNWQGLGKLPESLGNLPEWVIERGTVRVVLHQPNGEEPLVAVLQNAHLQLTPSGKRRYLVKGTVLAEPVGQVSLDGHWHLDDLAWQLTGRVDQFKFRTEVWDKVCEFLPEFRTRMAALPEKVGFPLPGAPVTDPRLEAVGDLLFRLEKSKTDPTLVYKVQMNVKSGSWTHPLFPYPLDDVQGRIFCDATQVYVPTLTARHGQLQVSVVKGLFDRTDPEGPISGFVNVKELPLEQRTRARLTKHLREVYDHLQPSGKIDLNMYVTYSKSVGLRCNSDIIPLGCSVAHEKFPYPVEGLRGIIKKRGQQVNVDLKGLAGQREVKFTGHVQNGPNGPREVFDAQVDNLPLDEVFVLSTPPAARNALRAMNLQGLANLHYHMTRTGGEGKPWETHLSGTLRAGSMKCKAFPYEISDLQGLLEYDGEAWIFSKLKGTHGTTELAGEGDYRVSEQTGLLSLTIRAVAAKFEQDLELALPESWRKLWQEFSPQGGFDCTTQLVWIPGQSPEISVEADLAETSFQLKSFPFPIEGVSGHVSFGRDETNPQLLRADLSEIVGQHEDTKINLKSGFALVEPTGQWRVRLDELQVEDLDPNNRFRRALPQGFREVIETLDPRDGRVALTGMMEMRGTGNSKDGVTSAWDLEILCTDTTVSTGIDLKHLYGKFGIKGTWDGKAIATNGWSDLTSMTILGYQFANVRGPIRINGNQLVIGSKSVVHPQVEPGGIVRRPQPEQRITGRAIDGVFTLDGIAVLGQETSYRVVLTMRDARLEKYAELYLPNQNDLRGKMTGEAELSGRGNSARNLTGRGQLLIQPAALYQLPVMLAVFKQLNGGSPDNTAFDEAQADFEIANNRFVFNKVDLKGAALNLKGNGWVHFDRRMSFNFFSSVSKARAPLAILQQVVGQATMGWMGVEVRGTLDFPIAHIRPAQRLDNAVKGILGGIDPGPPGGQLAPMGRRGPSAGFGPRQQ